MKRFRSFLIFTLLYCTAFTVGCSKNITPTNIIKKLKFKDIKSVMVLSPQSLGHPFEKGEFDFKNNEHAKVIKDIVNYLNSGKVQGDVEPYDYLKAKNAILILRLKDGNVIRIMPAYGVKHATNATSLFDIQDEVMIDTGNDERPIRILSPELRKLVDDGYKDTFNVH